MDSSIIKRAGEFLQEKSRHKRWQKTVAVLAVLVIFVTVWVLLMPASALVKRTYCGMEEHTHAETCYELVLVCGYADKTLGEADSETESQEVVMEPEDGGQHDVQVSEEDDQQSDAQVPEDGAQPVYGQAEAHVHADACYSVSVVEELVCGQEETEGHVHTDDCYTDGRELTCGQEESEEHTHADACYTEIHELTCGQEELQGHTHTDECLAAKEIRELICGQEESDTADGVEADRAEEIPVQEQPADSEELPAAGEEQPADGEEHVHTEACYVRMLVCGLEEHTHETLCYEEPFCGIAAHIHGADCYDETGNLVCEVQEHRHDQACYREPHCAVTAHVHGEGCYDEAGNLTCELEEHLHTALCYFEMPAYYCVERMHTHTQACMDENGNVVCGYANFVVHTHDAECYLSGISLLHGEGDTKDDAVFAKLDPEEDLICTLPEIEVHEHTEECYAQNGESGERELICEKQEIVLHEHTRECFDIERNLICGKVQVLEHHHYEECYMELEEAVEAVKIFENERLRVVAVYTTKANIPEEAELIAEEITAESDKEHYARREAEYQELMGSEYASMRALLKIGFYMDGAEIEPEEPVTVTVQFLDENGLEEGSPITVIHFGKEGTEVLEGSDAEDGSTTFEMESFSEIAIGYTEIKEEIGETRVQVSRTCEYEDAFFRAVFHIKGEVAIPAQLLAAEEEQAEKNGETVSGGDVENGAEAAGVDAQRIKQEDGTVLVILTEEMLPGEIEFKVERLDEKAEAYKAAVAAYGEDSDEAEVYLNQVLSYSLTYDGVKLDLTGSEVTVEVTPAPALVARAEETVGKAPDGQEIRAEVTFSLIHIASETGERETAGTEGSEPTDQNGTESVMAGEILAAETVTGESAAEPMRVTLHAAGTENAVAARAESQANPQFTVEFYAYIDRLVESHPTIKPVTVIDTSGGNLPANGAALTKKNIYISEDGTVQTQEQLTEIYASGQYHYIEAPGLVYFNKIAKNSNYRLKEIHVQREGSEEWEIYSCEEREEWHFTNRQETKDKYEDFILITSGATIRLVHDVEEKEVRNGTDFYDYDITDGSVYTYANEKLNAVSAEERSKVTTHDSGATWYMYTNRQGINGNLPGQTLGFGNSEGTVKTTMGELEGNRANAQNALYGSPTFGLVTGLKDGKVQYKSGVVAPNLFNDGDAKGKTDYVGDLVFRQRGDTYTLIGAEVKENGEIVSSVMGVDKFKRQCDNWNKTYYFAGNDFYPMDGVHSAGTGGHDLMFGSRESTSVIRNTSVKGGAANGGNLSGSLTAPLSDDGKNHNHYFGMHYTVEFDLVKDYIGPLEYLFYGDDDMWVFLDGPGYSGKLVCDIGGVHSSVGEYVDLWDYIPKGAEEAEGHYTLSFFYTERGASGSTCWMQFTLPSVSFATTQQDTGKLRIEKQVSGFETDEEFGFEIHFYENAHMDDSNILKDSYSYTKYDAVTNEPIEKDVLIWDDAKFTLKANEYIVISFLPEGSYYSISETGPVTVLPREPGEAVEWEVKPENPYTPEITKEDAAAGSGGKISGAITKNTEVKIRYNNIQKFVLPETGGNGIRSYTIAGALLLTFGAGLLYRKKQRV